MFHPITQLVQDLEQHCRVPLSAEEALETVPKISEWQEADGLPFQPAREGEMYQLDRALRASAVEVWSGRQVYGIYGAMRDVSNALKTLEATEATEALRGHWKKLLEHADKKPILRLLGAPMGLKTTMEQDYIEGREAQVRYVSSQEDSLIVPLYAARVGAMEREIFGYAGLRPGEEEAQLGGDRTLTVLALNEKDELLGYAYGYHFDDPVLDQEVFYLSGMARAPEALSLGLGRGLLEEITQVACQRWQDVEAIALHVDSTNQAARALYKKNGFRDVSLCSAYYAILDEAPQIRAPAYTMARHLSEESAKKLALSHPVLTKVALDYLDSLFPTAEEVA